MADDATFTNEAMRIALSGFPVFEVWSPIGYVLAGPFSLIGNSTLKGMHYISWWIHMLGAFTFIGLIATDKLGHIMISSLNVYFGNLDNNKPETHLKNGQIIVWDTHFTFKRINYDSIMVNPNFKLIKEFCPEYNFQFYNEDYKIAIFEKATNIKD